MGSVSVGRGRSPSRARALRLDYRSDASADRRDRPARGPLRRLRPPGPPAAAAGGAAAGRADVEHGTLAGVRELHQGAGGGDDGGPDSVSRRRAQARAAASPRRGSRSGRFTPLRATTRGRLGGAGGAAGLRVIPARAVPRGAVPDSPAAVRRGVRGAEVAARASPARAAQQPRRHPGPPRRRHRRPAARPTTSRRRRRQTRTIPTTRSIAGTPTGSIGIPRRPSTG